MEDKKFLVKGNAMQSISIFVKEKYPEQYGKWLSKLPDKVSAFYKSIILEGDWYPAEFVKPASELIAEMFFDGDKAQAYYEIGKYSFNRSYEKTYKPVYEGTEKDVLFNLMSGIVGLYFNFGHVEIEQENNKVTYIFKDFPVFLADNFWRILGFIEQMFFHFYKKPIKQECFFVKTNQNMGDGHTIYYFD